MADKPALNLEELNLEYEGKKPAKHAFRARVQGRHDGSLGNQQS